jgi:hypothetical protein
MKNMKKALANQSMMPIIPLADKGGILLFPLFGKIAVRDKLKKCLTHNFISLEWPPLPVVP